MARKTIERLNALHPEVPSAPVTIRSRSTPGSAIITIRGVSTNDLYLSHYLNGLLDEYVAFTRSVDQERSQRVLKSFLQAVVETQGTMEMASKELQALRKASESISVRIELERLPDRLKRLRNERDDLRLLPTSKLPAIEAEVQYIESQLDEYEAAASKTKIATERFESARKAYSELFEHSETFQQMLSPCGDYIVVMERATYPIKLSASQLFGVDYPTFGGFFGFLIACFRLKYPQARLGSTQ